MWSYDEGWVRTRVGPSLHQKYFDHGRIAAEDSDYDVWPSRVMANIYQNNLKPEEALGKVLNELERALATNPNQPSGDEHGPLTVKNSMFIDEDGQYYNSLCISSFQLIKLIADGQQDKAEAVIQQAIDLGFREFRVFASFNGGLGRFIPLEYVNYDKIVSHYIDIMDQVKRRSEITVFADAQNWCKEIPNQLSFLTRMANLFDGRDLVSGELANESALNGIDPTKFNKPKTSNLWSSGSNASDVITFDPIWDYVTYHEGRDAEWVRRNNCRDIREHYRVPVRSDEPIGAGPDNIPGKRSNNPQDFYEFAVNQALNSNGFTFHSQAGTGSNLLEGAELDCAVATVEGFNKVDASWFTGAYTRGGLSDCPLVHDDTHELRTFCRLMSNQARCIVIRSDHVYRESANGWEVTKIDGPNDEYVELEKP